jgi:rhodanese-related sulfurtransferase
MSPLFKRLFAVTLLGFTWGCQDHFQAARVTPQEVQTRLAAKEPLIIADVRIPWAYVSEHIANATNIRFDDIEAGSDPKLPKDRWIVLYCECPNEEESDHIAHELHDKFGYDKLQLLKGGLDDWKLAGYKTVVMPQMNKRP